MLASPMARAESAPLEFQSNLGIETPDVSGMNLVPARSSVDVKVANHRKRDARDKDQWQYTYGVYTYNCLISHIKNMKDTSAKNRILNAISSVEIRETSGSPDAHYYADSNGVGGKLVVELRLSSYKDNQGVPRIKPDGKHETDLIPSYGLTGMRFCSFGVVPKADSILDELAGAPAAQPVAPGQAQAPAPVDPALVDANLIAQMQGATSTLSIAGATDTTGNPMATKLPDSTNVQGSATALNVSNQPAIKN
jgi:hypothetical protein